MLDAPTAALGLIAGGASGIVGMSSELGADDRLVAFMQYLRVLVVVVVTPIAIAIFSGGHHGAAEVPGTSTLGEWWEWPLTAVLGVSGALAAARLKITGGGAARPDGASPARSCSAAWPAASRSRRCSGRRRSR